MYGLELRNSPDYEETNMKRTKKKLSLNRETLRTLNAGDSRRVVGGRTVDDPTQSFRCVCETEDDCPVVVAVRAPIRTL